AAVRKEIEHATTARERSRQTPVLALIEKESGLLSFTRIDFKPKTRFANRRCRPERQRGTWQGGRRLDVIHRAAYPPSFLAPARNDIVFQRQSFDLSRREIVLEKNRACIDQIGRA